MNNIREILTNVKTTNYGLKFIPITRKDWDILEVLSYISGWTDFDRREIEIHFMNGKYAFLDAKYQTPINNEYDLAELYDMAEKNLI